MTDGVKELDVEAVGVTDGVALGVRVPEWVWVLVPDGDGDGVVEAEGDSDRVRVALGVTVEEGDGLPDLDGDLDGLRVLDGVPLTDPVVVPVGDDDPVADGVSDTHAPSPNDTLEEISASDSAVALSSKDAAISIVTSGPSCARSIRSDLTVSRPLPSTPKNGVSARPHWCPTSTTSPPVS